ncbi:MAG: transcriptional regulator [Burkholderiales bacterium]
MFTVATTQRFESDAATIWSEAEIEALIFALAMDPHQGDVIPGTGGLRKLRWARSGMGKRGGARVITYVIDKLGKVWLLTAYTKAELDNLSAATLTKLRKELINV